VFSHLSEQQVIGGLGFVPANMKPHSFSERQLATIALMLDEAEKNTAE